MREIWLALIFAAQLLGTARAQSKSTDHLNPKLLQDLPASAPTKVEAYGRDPLEFGELRLPQGPGPFPVAVMIHRGCFTKGFGSLRDLSPLATALTGRGLATWNIEYRRLGDKGGGWPGSFLDWAAATDHLRDLGRRYALDLSKVVVVGHSAGASASLWVGARGRLPQTSPIRGGNPLSVAAVVAVDGPIDLRSRWDEKVCGGRPVISELFGGSPTEVADRYTQGDPAELLPWGVSVTLVASVVLLPQEAETLRKAASEKGDSVEVLVLQNNSHFDMLSPKKPSGVVLEDLVLEALGIEPH